MLEGVMNWLSRLCYLEWIKRKWTDPVWSKVFASGIIAIILYIYLLLKSAYESIPVKDSYEKTVEFLVNTKYQVNLFTIVVIGVLIIILFLTPRIIVMIRNYKRETFSPSDPANGAEIMAGTPTDTPGTHRIVRTSTDIPITNGLVMQLDASDISSLFLTFNGNQTVTSGNQPVGLWKDKSGNNNHLSQVRPEFRPRSVFEGIGNMPSVEFDIGKSMFIATNFPTPVTVIYIARQTGGWNRRVLTAVRNNWLLGYWRNAKNQGFYGNWVSPEDHRPFTDDSCHIFSGIIRGPGYNSEVWADGEIVAANQNGTEGPNGLAINTGGFPNETSDCQVAEIIVFNRAISQLERVQVEAYLQAKWGIIY
jgi:hypothetical protein